MLDALNTLTLLCTPRVGRKTARLLLTFASPSTAGPEALANLFREARVEQPRLPQPTPADLEGAQRRAGQILEQARREQIAVLVPQDPDFPGALRDIPDAPVLLYARGEAAALGAARRVAVIGTREPTPYGEERSFRLGAAFAERDFVVISGLAEGCDAAAHRGCLGARGRTVAVLAHGLDMVYPAAHRELTREILDCHGCLLSEYPPGERPQRSYFVERDRLQSGLSEAVVVVETDVQGGTMHTVRFAQEQGRMLACVQHPEEYATHPKSAGNRLMRERMNAVALYSRADLDQFISRLAGQDAAASDTPGRTEPDGPATEDDSEPPMPGTAGGTEHSATQLSFLDPPG